MLYVINTEDKPGALELRMETRPQHLEYIKELGDALLLAGPFVDDDDKMIGSLLVIKADSLDEAKEMAARDPYAKAGVFASSEVKPWKWLVKAPEGI